MFTKPTLPAAHLKDRRRTPSPGREQAGLNSQIRALQTRVADLEGQIAALRQSTSWRISAPLRWISRHLKGRDALLDAASLRRSESYEEWIRLYDTPPSSMPQANLGAELKKGRPLFISVALLGEPASPALVAATLASIEAQTYPHLEVMLPRDSAPLPPIDRARGDWLLVLRPGDVLPPYAMGHFASEIAAHPGAQVIYSDDDVLDAHGRRRDPVFKPDWNSELFHVRDFVDGCFAVTKTAALDVGGLREGFGHATAYDLLLRLTERIGTGQIRHIPRVLRHRSGNIVAGTDSERRALADYFARVGSIARVVDAGEGIRVKYVLPPDRPLVSLVIPTRNGLALLRQCVESIVAETSYPNYELLIVDNGSDDPATLAYLEELRGQPGMSVIRDESPFNYSALNNMAVGLARGEVIGLINNDIEVISPDWLDEMVSLALQPGVGAVGAKLLYPDGTVQHGGILLGVGGATSIAAHANKFLSAWDGGYMGRALALQSFSAVTAACLVVRKALYEQVGGLNEVELKVAYNDVDFCLRVREAGYRNLWTPHAKLFHHESATRGSDFSPEHRQRFEKEQAYMRSRWGALIARDPAYNPNLTVYAEDFGLAWPPRVPWLAGAAKP